MTFDSVPVRIDATAVEIPAWVILAAVLAITIAAAVAAWLIRRRRRPR